LLSGPCNASGLQLPLNPPPEPSHFGEAAAGAATPHPIHPASAEKYRSELDWSDAGPDALSFRRIYRSNWANDDSRGVSGLGRVWSHNHHYVLRAGPAANPTSATIVFPEGYVRTFALAAGSSAWNATNGADSLSRSPSGGWSWRRADDDATFEFDAAGRLLSRTARNGWTTRYTYTAAGQLASATNAFGRTLTFAHSATGQLVSATTPDGRVIGYAFDSAARLASVIYPDGKSRSFLYENPSFTQALTGIVDETGRRWGSFSYDGAGRADVSELAGGDDRYQVSYPTSDSATVTDPLGVSRTYRYGTAKGKLAITAGSLPSARGQDDAASRVQDASSGLITAETDFMGIRSDTTWDVARRLPLSVTAASGTPEARTRSTQWHARFALPVLITEPGRATALVYDTAGNLLSRTVGHTAPFAQKAQTWSWTYTDKGLVATETEPNGAVTRYTHDERGNVLTMTNALGHVTSHVYDAANRLLSTTAPNGQVTTYAWDTRDRLS
jgi:YD repeat-containing protein